MTQKCPTYQKLPIKYSIKIWLDKTSGEVAKFGIKLKRQWHTEETERNQ